MRKTNKNPYQSFPEYILRTPLLPFSFYQELTAKEKISNEDFSNLLKNKVFLESLFLASPILYQEAIKWLNQETTNTKKVKRLKYSLLKYISRMCSRCTPFGLFAGCAIGQISTETTIQLAKASQHKRHTRLDMNYLVALSQDLNNYPIIREQLVFFPNSSIYQVGEQLRYVEYYYHNSNRHHHIAAVAASPYLLKILERASDGALLMDLAKIIVEEDISLEEALEFINDLVKNQLLVSELEPAVSGPEFLEQLTKVLKKIKGIGPLQKTLQTTLAHLKKLDQTIGQAPIAYYDLSKTLKKIGTSFELKYLFQTDMVLNAPSNTISAKVVEDIKKCLSLLNRLTQLNQNSLFNNFKNAFYERYETREVALSKALDVEIGLGYNQNQAYGDVNPLLKTIAWPDRTNVLQAKDIKWTEIHSIFRKKISETLSSKGTTLTLKSTDFKDFEENWKNLPDTYSVIIQLVSIQGKTKISLQGIGGSSATNLLSRFCHGDKRMLDYVQKITKAEDQMAKDKLLAEIVHLPEARVGNILMRPQLRKYEIPYLTKSLIDNAHQLTVDDLYLSYKNNRLVLRSKKWNKEVVPRLSNAHAYNIDSLPIYHFLSDLQTQDLRAGLFLNISPLIEEYDFLPRIEYENIILSRATWNIRQYEIQAILDAMEDMAQFKKAVKAFKTTKQLPQYVLLIDGDNELMVNLDNLTVATMFFDFVKARPSFKLSEFLFEEDGVVKSRLDDTYYTNQIILSFFNEKKLRE